MTDQKTTCNACEEKPPVPHGLTGELPDYTVISAQHTCTPQPTTFEREIERLQEVAKADTPEGKALRQLGEGACKLLEQQEDWWGDFNKGNRENGFQDYPPWMRNFITTLLNKQDALTKERCKAVVKKYRDELDKWDIAYTVSNQILEAIETHEQPDT